MPLPGLTVERIDDGLFHTRGADVDVAFHVRGDGPPVVLLHGTSANHAVWQAVGDALEAKAMVIALDQRGHGRSDKPSAGYGAADFAGDVITVMDALGADRATVGGHSLGGRNSWVTAAMHPERVTAAVVVDYTPFVEPEVLDELQVRVDGGFRCFSDSDEIEEYLRARYPAILPEAIERRARWGYRRRKDGRWEPRADPDAMRQLIDGFRTPHESEFLAVAAPMTHLRGGRSAIVSEAAWQSAKERRPQDRWVVIPEADHYIPEEFPLLISAEFERVLG